MSLKEVEEKVPTLANFLLGGAREQYRGVRGKRV